jgi:ABC-type uncharacterized transport system ATPase subunit
MNEFAIETHELRKSFRKQAALAGLNLKVPAGSIFGFLGRNGAGKTTTIKLLMGILKPDGGEARVCGLCPGNFDEGIAIRRRIGYPRTTLTVEARVKLRVHIGVGAGFGSVGFDPLAYRATTFIVLGVIIKAVVHAFKELGDRAILEVGFLMRPMPLKEVPPSPSVEARSFNCLIEF